MTDLSMFANRLAKMYKHISKWARRQGVTCYRIYDHDVPQFPFAVDKYEQYIYISEYETGYFMDESERDSWFYQCLGAIAVETESSLDQCFFKTRKIQKGKSQYEKIEDDEHFETVVTENGLKFKVNFTDYLDTGLFLDHRPLREKVRATVANKTVLNLFAYTGSFSVYAAAGNADLIVTVDLSNTYLTWAKENMTLNELYDASKHHYIQDDCLQWLADPPNGTKFDIIVMDPPTFSNSKRMRNVLDIQRDHVTLINDALRLLSPDGVLYFSTNFRKFRIQKEELHTTNVKEITAQTIPQDFRDQKIHYCYEIRL